MREGWENCLKYLKREVEQKRQEEKQTILKRDGKLGALKKRGWKRLTNYAIFEQTS